MSKKPKKKDHILVIGAGPAGLHMAFKLRERAYKNITIVDGNDRIGGMSDTIHANGLPHEMGTCYLHPGYSEIKRLLRVTQATREVKPGGKHGDRDIYSPLLNQYVKSKKASKPLEIGDWLEAEIERMILPSWLRILPNALEKIPLILAIKRYQAIHRKVFGDYSYSLPPRPNSKHWKRINKTFGQFLEDEKLIPLDPFFRLSSTVMGYGLLHTVPAYYGMMWNTPALLEAFVQSAKDPEAPVLTVLEDGFAALWKGVVKQAKASAKKDKAKWDLKLGHFVTRVDRSGPQIQVYGEDKKGKTWKKSCDWLVVANGLAPALNFLDATEEERTLFSSMISVTLVTQIFELDEPKGPAECIAYWPDELNVGQDGGVYALRDTGRTLQKSEDPKPKKRLGVTYQYFDRPIPNESKWVTELAVDDLKNKGFKEPRLWKEKGNPQSPVVRIWNDYFTRFTQRALNEGAPWELLKMQGKNRTWFTSGDACFESTHDISQYNLMLLDQELGPDPLS